MKACEARVVKRRLEMIPDLYALAQEKDKESVALADMYFRIATPGAIPIEAKPSTTSPADPASKYNEIFSDQLEADRKAAEYRAEANRASNFITSLEPDKASVLADVFIRGRRHTDVAKSRRVTPDCIRKQIDRAIEDAPTEIARACGLL